MMLYSLNRLSAEDRKPFIERVLELRNYYQMSYEAIARLVSREFEIPITTPTIVRIYNRFQ